jgi:hypothetical protein
MLLIIPPFRADRFACPLFGLPITLRLAVLLMQTLRQRKVAAARENKRPQLFGGFVLSGAAFFFGTRSRGRRDILRKRSVLLTPLIGAAWPNCNFSAHRI